MTDDKKIQQFELAAEFFTDDDGPKIILTQPDDGYYEPDKIFLHPSQLRTVCEEFGIIPTGDPEATKTIATLTRRLLVLRDRSEHLAQYLSNHIDHKSVDLSYEMNYATATADIAGEFCAELGKPLFAPTT